MKKLFTMWWQNHLTAHTVRTFLIPYDRGSLVSLLMEQSVVLQTEYTAEGTKITAECDQATADQVEKALRR